MTKEIEKKRQPNSFQKGIRNVTWMLIGFMVVMVPIVSISSDVINPVPLTGYPGLVYFGQNYK